jgi:hypothetical protein
MPGSFLAHVKDHGCHLPRVVSVIMQGRDDFEQVLTTKDLTISCLKPKSLAHISVSWLLCYTGCCVNVRCVVVDMTIYIMDFIVYGLLQLWIVVFNFYGPVCSRHVNRGDDER